MENDKEHAGRDKSASPKRVRSTFDERMTTERAILQAYIRDQKRLPTTPQELGNATIINPVPENTVGRYRERTARKLVTPDLEVVTQLIDLGESLQNFGFIEAGPREKLYHDPQAVRAVIITSGGLAPGMNCVVHSIVNRHWNTYAVNAARQGGIFGVAEGFSGLRDKPLQLERLEPEATEGWLDIGGSMLGSVRLQLREDELERVGQEIAENLRRNRINILYVIGGDGSLRMAHTVARSDPHIGVVGIPKTMDNDILWVWQSFGVSTTVERAVEIVNTLHAEAVSTRRVCIIELFGAESGFIAAFATLASGRVDLVLVPEPFEFMPPDHVGRGLNTLLDYLAQAVREKKRPHGVVVLAEGVGAFFEQRNIWLGSTRIKGKHFANQLMEYLQANVIDRRDKPLGVFVNQPRHNIRAVPANAHDRIYCERLGVLAVDSALAGYSDFMISQWLTEYVLVPLELVAEERRQKSIPPVGMLWSQTQSSTGQPVILR